MAERRPPLEVEQRYAGWRAPGRSRIISVRAETGVAPTIAVTTRVRPRPYASVVTESVGQIIAVGRAYDPQ